MTLPRLFSQLANMRAMGGAAVGCLMPGERKLWQLYMTKPLTD